MAVIFLIFSSTLGAFAGLVALFAFQTTFLMAFTVYLGTAIVLTTVFMAVQVFKTLNTVRQSPQMSPLRNG